MRCFIFHKAKSRLVPTDSFVEMLAKRLCEDEGGEPMEAAPAFDEPRELGGGDWYEGELSPRWMQYKKAARRIAVAMACLEEQRRWGGMEWK